MKQKINVRLVVVAVLAAMLTMLGIISVCYGLFQNQVEKDLRITAKVLSAAGISKLTNEPGGYVDDDIISSVRYADISYLNTYVHKSYGIQGVLADGIPKYSNITPYSDLIVK